MRSARNRSSELLFCEIGLLHLPAADDDLHIVPLFLMFSDLNTVCGAKRRRRFRSRNRPCHHPRRFRLRISIPFNQQLGCIAFSSYSQNSVDEETLLCLSYHSGNGGNFKQLSIMLWNSAIGHWSIHFPHSDEEVECVLVKCGIFFVARFPFLALFVGAKYRSKTEDWRRMGFFDFGTPELGGTVASLEVG